MVTPPSVPGTIRFLIRTLANVPRVMTRSLPRRRAVTVEIFRLDPARLQILARRRRRLDRAGRRNVIGRDRIAENSKCARAADLLDLSRLHREILEKRRLVNVIALLIPLVNVARARGNFVPLRILIGEIAIKFSERFRLERGLHRMPDFTETRPEVA